MPPPEIEIKVASMEESLKSIDSGMADLKIDVRKVSDSVHNLRETTLVEFGKIRSDVSGLKMKVAIITSVIASAATWAINHILSK